MSNIKHKWKHPSLSELTPMVFAMGLTNLGSEASKLQSVRKIALTLM